MLRLVQKRNESEEREVRMSQIALSARALPLNRITCFSQTAAALPGMLRSNSVFQRRRSLYGSSPIIWMDPPTFETSSDSKIECLDEFHIAVDQSSRAINMDTLLPELLAFPPKPLPATPLTDTEYDIQIKGVLKLLNQLPVKRLIGDVAGGGNLLNVRLISMSFFSTLCTRSWRLWVLDIGSFCEHTSLPLRSSCSYSWYQYQTSVNHNVRGIFADQLAMEKDCRLLGAIRHGANPIRRVGVWASYRDCCQNSKVCMHGLFISSYPRARIGPRADYFQPQAAILPIRTAILRLDPSSACFTSNHLLFVRLCLEAREYRAALPILGKDIFYFPSPAIIELVHINPPFPCSPHEFSSTFITMTSHLSAKLGYTHHLQYFIFGAMIYMKLKHWERALHFLEIVITCPTANTASMIQVEAYKKWILVNLVAYGIVSIEKYLLATHLWLPKRCPRYQEQSTLWGLES